jgi:hypothetical protein
MQGAIPPLGTPFGLNWGQLGRSSDNICNTPVSIIATCEMIPPPCHGSPSFPIHATQQQWLVWHGSSKSCYPAFGVGSRAISTSQKLQILTLYGGTSSNSANFILVPSHPGYCLLLITFTTPSPSYLTILTQIEVPPRVPIMLFRAEIFLFSTVLRRCLRRPSRRRTPVKLINP